MCQYSLVADVGATNARFALVTDMGELHKIAIFPCADYPNLESAMLAYLVQENAQTLVRAACIAIAGTVHQPIFKLANNHWQVNKAHVHATLGFEVVWVNDFTAQAWAMSQISPSDLVTIKPGADVSRGNRLVMGPGTGLGVAGLVAHGDSWLPVMGEGGHVGFAPGNAEHSEILSYMWQQREHVSAERLLSGSGLMGLYAAVAHVSGQPENLTDVATLVQRAQSATPDPLALQTLSVFCSMLGHCVANAALLYGAVGGVYLTGGILPRIQEFLMASDFTQHFTNKGRLSSYLKDIPIYLCKAEQPGLQGAAIALEQTLRR